MKLEIDYSFGYIFDKSKLIVMWPVGTLEMDKEEYEMEVEVAFLEDGVYDAFSKEDIDFANESIKPLEMYLYNPSKIVPFVTSIKDFETKEELENMLVEFDEEYELKDYYEEKGYEFKSLVETCEDITKYIPNENLETLNILKTEKDSFDLEKLIKKCGENALTKVSKSEISNRLFTSGDKCIYLSFGRINNGRIETINGDIFENLDFDMGDLEVNENRDFGYLIEEQDNILTVKIANSNKTLNGNFLVQIVDYSGNFKKMMIDYLEKFRR